MKKILGITLLGVLGIVWGATCLAADEDPPPPATVEELDARLEEILKDTGTPGLIGTIVVGDEVIWTGAIGVAEREGNRAVTPATRFSNSYCKATWEPRERSRPSSRGDGCFWR